MEKRLGNKRAAADGTDGTHGANRTEEESSLPLSRASFPVRDYDLAATLSSGQAFRWQPHGTGWVGVIGSQWVRLGAGPTALQAETSPAVSDWNWLRQYLQLEVDLSEVIGTFPNDPPMQSAVAACRGLRLLRQEPWECLASFILSSTKQIVQIQQIVALLCSRYGEVLPVPPGYAPAYRFPSPARLTEISEAELRACKMGFRAPYLLAAARRIASGELDLAHVGQLSVEAARAELMHLPGVGPKIANCVLLFGYGFASAFPVDVWILKALRQLYFPRRKVNLARLQEFSATHFGPYGGYAQQYLFHYMRTRDQQPPPEKQKTSDRTI